MLAFLAKLRAFGTLIGLAFLLLLAAIAEHFRRSRDRWKERARDSEAQIEYRDAVDESDAEISAEYSDIRERDDKGNLLRPNEW